MKNPFPVNLQTSAEVRAQGWQAESRDSDGHLISCHAPIEADDTGIAEWIAECTSRGETVTFWPATGDVAAVPTPSPQTHVVADLLARWREGEFENTADEAAQSALDQQSDSFDAAPIIEAWLSALATTEGSQA